jgi:hypothetical protein
MGQVAKPTLSVLHYLDGPLDSRRGAIIVCRSEFRDRERALKPDTSQGKKSGANPESHLVGPGSLEGLTDAEKAEIKTLLAAGEEEEAERLIAVHRAKIGMHDAGERYLQDAGQRRTNFVWSKRVAAYFAVGLILLLILLSVWILRGNTAHK